MSTILPLILSSFFISGFFYPIMPTHSGDNILERIPESAAKLGPKTGEAVKDLITGEILIKK